MIEIYTALYMYVYKEGNKNSSMVGGYRDGVKWKGEEIRIRAVG